MKNECDVTKRQPDGVVMSGPSILFSPIPEVPCVPVKALEPTLHRPFPRWKRAIDIIGASIALVCLSPQIILVALLIKATSRGPILFTQLRGGRGGVPFKVYKFRTMVVDAEARKAELLHLNERSGPAFKMKKDPRVTPVGRFLRATSMDELPQFFNVLMGDMSIVGPRPLPIAECHKFDQWHRRRLEVKPGLTCIWQVSARENQSFDHWVRQDIEYIENLSFWLDLKLILKTIPAVISRRGAH